MEHPSLARNVYNKIATKSPRCPGYTVTTLNLVVKNGIKIRALMYNLTTRIHLLYCLISEVLEVYERVACQNVHTGHQKYTNRKELIGVKKSRIGKNAYIQIN